MPVKDLPCLKMKWRAWWSKLCPEDASVAPADRSWASLRKSGKNGFLLVMVCLTWWGSAAGAGNEWREAVEEVIRALRWLEENTTPSVKGNLPPVTTSKTSRNGKRKRPEGDKEDSASSGHPSRKIT
jgi:hypothetical protein